MPCWRRQPRDSDRSRVSADDADKANLRLCFSFAGARSDAQAARSCWSLAAIETRRPDKSLRYALRRCAGAMQAGVPMMFAPAFDGADERLAAQNDPIRHDFALGNCGAKTPGCAEKHAPLGGLA